jgi:hypothetical protein
MAPGAIHMPDLWSLDSGKAGALGGVFLFQVVLRNITPVSRSAW